MTPAQSAGLEQRARELLAKEYDRAGYDCNATAIREGTRTGDNDKWALRAIVAALAAPAADGVLVPREALQFWADILADGRTKTDSGLDVTVLELIDVNQACAREMRKYLAAAPQAQGEG